MKKKFLNKCLAFLKKYNSYTKEDEEKILYGLEGLYLTFTKLIFIFVLSVILGIFKEVLVTILLFNIIRFFGFGFHAEKSWQCLIISTTIFVLVPLLFINIKINLLTKIIICIICILNFTLFAPADTVKRPLPNKRKRLIRKLGTIIIGSIYFVLIIFFDSWISPLLLVALVNQAIAVNPLIYKLFKQPYNNYKNYIPD